MQQSADSSAKLPFVTGNLNIVTDSSIVPVSTTNPVRPNTLDLPGAFDSNAVINSRIEDLKKDSELERIIQQLKDSPSLQESIRRFKSPNIDVSLLNSVIAARPGGIALDPTALFSRTAAAPAASSTTLTTPNGMGLSPQQVIGLCQGLYQAANTPQRTDANAQPSVLLQLASPQAAATTPLVLGGNGSLQFPMVNLAASTAGGLVYPQQIGPTLASPSKRDVPLDLGQKTTSSSPDQPSPSDSSYGAGKGGESGADPLERSRLSRLERKRARNRDAAKKCRERKLSLIRSLELHVATLVESNKNLRAKILKSRKDVDRLKNFVSSHVEQDCVHRDQVMSPAS